MSEPVRRTAAQNAGLLLGLAAFIAVLVTEPPAGMEPAAWQVAGVMALMALWWATEALPLAATALLPMAVLPLLGAASGSSLAGGYGNPTIFLILGGFLLALAMERSNLHRRIAYTIVAWAGGHPQGLILGMMCATGLVSMWASNTATALMMLPVALSVARIVSPGEGGDDRNARNFACAVVLCVSYGATIGGLATLVGTPTNALVVGFMQENFGQSISFAQWLVFGLPTVLLLMPVAWLALVRWAFPFTLGSQAAAREAVQAALAGLGPVTVAERRVAMVFVATASAWILGPLLQRIPGLALLNDNSVALLAGASLFLIPTGMPAGGGLLAGPDIRRVPWDVLLLFGGGLALAVAIQDSGLAAHIGQSLAVLGTWPIVALTAAVVALLVFWTELNSNIASAATFMPILAAIAAGTDYPALQLVAPAAIATSCAFMLPVGTPPNAIVFASGQITIRQMMRAGWYVNLAAIAIITGVSALVLPYIAG